MQTRWGTFWDAVIIGFCSVLLFSLMVVLNPWVVVYESLMPLLLTGCTILVAYLRGRTRVSKEIVKLIYPEKV